MNKDIAASDKSAGGMYFYVISSPGMGIVCAFRYGDNARAHCNKHLSYYTIHKVWIPIGEIQYWLDESKDLDRCVTVDNTTKQTPQTVNLFELEINYLKERLKQFEQKINDYANRH